MLGIVLEPGRLMPSPTVLSTLLNKPPLTNQYQETPMFVVVKTINNQPTAHMELELTTDTTEEYVLCTTRQEACEVCNLWNAYRYMSKTISLVNALTQVREPNYPGSSEIEAHYNRYVSHQASRFGNDVDPE